MELNKNIRNTDKKINKDQKTKLISAKSVFILSSLFNLFFQTATVCDEFWRIAQIRNLNNLTKIF